MASQNSLVLLNRHLSLKENSPFTLVVDSLAQSSYYLLQEFAYKFGGPILYLSFETTNNPEYASGFLDCAGLNLQQIAKFVLENTPKTRALVIVDSLNYIANEELTAFISSIVLPNLAVLGCFHVNIPQHSQISYPGALILLRYIALSIFEVEPVRVLDEEEETKISRLQFPINSRYNQPTFKLTLTNRRKSGKSLTHHYILDVMAHQYEIFQPQQEMSQDSEELLKDLTTFNLTTSTKQKLAREQVELPFMEAQTELGKFGGAIVYEFEKDDDYDEEDPYEDPF